MTYLFLKAQGAPSIVWRGDIDHKTGEVVSKVNCQIKMLKTEKARIEFSVHAGALPFPITKSAKPALALVPFVKELNREELRLTNLPAGTYRLKIDGEEVGQYSSKDWEQGINLALNEKTPQYRQAMEILSLNAERQRLEYMLRTEAMLKVVLKQRGVVFDGNNRKDVERMFSSEEVKALFSPGGALAKGGTGRYWKRYQNEKNMLGRIPLRIEDMIKQFYQKNQPKEHIYTIELVAGKDSK
jgi:hypothetical protein